LKKYLNYLNLPIPKPHSFISTPPVQASVLGIFSIKNIRKYLTVKNLILGLIGLTVMGLVKTLGIPMFILSFLCLENSELLQYIVAGMFGVVSRLGFKGNLEEISNINYATMGEDPTNGSSPSYGVARGSGDSDLPQGQDKGSSESGTEM